MAGLGSLLEGNRRYAEGFDAAGLPAAPSRRLAVLTCMDARLDPHRFLGLELGDAHVIRNAGGRASEDALRSLVVSSWSLGTDEVVVIHHTDCGMQTLEETDLRSRLTEGTGTDASGLSFLGFSDLEESVREDVRAIRGSPFLGKRVSIAGFVYEVDSGRLRAIDA